ncbi:MAG: PorT family protein [Flavobacteriaceae bacterium]|nr:PorT family protein [Flavobacteriaceae bacterium]
MKHNFYFILIFLSFNSTFLFSQDETQVNQKGEWIFVNNIGFATLEAENTFKINVTAFEGLIAKELILNNKVSLIIGIEHLRIKGDFNSADNQLFITNNYIAIPVTARLFLSREQKMTIFVDLGIYGSYLHKSRVEDITNNVSNTEKDLGTNFGFQANIGARYKISKKLSISFGIKSKTDVLNSSKSSVQEFKVTDFYAFQFGLGLTL